MGTSSCPGSISMESTCGVLPTAAGATNIPSVWQLARLWDRGAPTDSHGLGSTDHAPILELGQRGCISSSLLR